MKTLSTLPRRLRTMERLRNIYDSVTFTTTNDSVTAMFKYAGDAELCQTARGSGTLVSEFSLRFTMTEFDCIYF